jgi:hypothetical protein
MLLNEEQLNDFIDTHFTREAFRLEQLSMYVADSDADNVRAYLAGEDGPSWRDGGPWFDQLAAERAAGRRRYRVRVWASPIGDYERYEAEWGYVYTTAAGEEVQVLDLAETAKPAGLLREDFYLLDDAFVVAVRYGDDHRFLGGEPLPDADLDLYRRCRDDAMAAVEPFSDWWDRHPEVHRDTPGTGNGRLDL